MRPLLIAVGVIVLLMGTAFALQGAYVIPASFMRGPDWVAIGAAIALVGVAIIFLGVRRTSPAKGTGGQPLSPRAR